MRVSEQRSIWGSRLASARCIVHAFAADSPMHPVSSSCALPTVVRKLSLVALSQRTYFANLDRLSSLSDVVDAVTR